MLICFEGIDGSGKETQAGFLFQYLQTNNIDSKIISFPEYDKPIGSIIKQALKNASFNIYTMQFLFAAERSSHLEKLEQSISNGSIVIIDRYRWSGFVYGVSNGLPRGWAVDLESHIPEPDITFLLDIDEKTSRARSGGTDSYEINLPLLKECRTEYLKLASQKKSWHLIDGNLSKEKIHIQVREIVQNKIK